MKTIFLLYKSKMNLKGLCPIRCRITLNKSRKEFSTGLLIIPDLWNSKKQKLEPSENSDFINTQLSLIRQKLNQAFLFLQVNNDTFNIDDIYSKYKGEKPKKEFGVVEVYGLFTKRLMVLVGKEIKQVTYDKYLESGKHLKDFIKFNFKKNDIPLKEVKSNFLEEYEYYLKTKKNFQQSTLNKAIQRFRRVIKYAIAQNYLDKDPFLLFSYKTVKKEVIFLNSEELSKLEKHHFDIPRIEKVKDLFVFCCYTGLAFKEMRNLKHSDISVGFDGKKWINVKRNKTGRSYNIPILKQADVIIEKFTEENRELVFPIIANSNFNAYLKEIAVLVGIKKHLTHHLARKTFATTVLLYNDVPMEIVSKLLGHSKIQTTQDHYGHILDEKVSEQMQRIAEKLK
ncbi:tyrosine-type recombinase/integrase [Bizionia paragorgiae]|uniref:tyrosine-type recombinase/integrase n=1 Tax=Bizionia paragorgiae TaxID=283786 RepID=UPI003A931DD6